MKRRGATFGARLVQCRDVVHYAGRLESAWAILKEAWAVDEMKAAL
jgi:hypothetical protein